MLKLLIRGVSQDITDVTRVSTLLPSVLTIGDRPKVLEKPKTRVSPTQVDCHQRQSLLVID